MTTTTGIEGSRRLAAERRRLPWVEIDKEYRFAAPTVTRRWTTSSTAGHS